MIRLDAEEEARARNFDAQQSLWRVAKPPTDHQPISRRIPRTTSLCTSTAQPPAYKQYANIATALDMPPNRSAGVVLLISQYDTTPNVMISSKDKPQELDNDLFATKERWPGG